MSGKSLFPMLLAALGMSCGGGDSVARAVLPPPPPPSGQPNVLFYSTLDNAAEVLSPAMGSGVGVQISTKPANDFVLARLGFGLRTDTVAERILIPQTDGAVQNIELDRGTIEFWYRPLYNHDNNLKYTIVGTGNWPGAPAGRGSWHLGKQNNSNQNSIFLMFYDAAGVRYEHVVTANNYGWRAGDWLQIRLTWDFGLPPGTQNMHLYVNGRELPLTGTIARGTHLMPAERSDEKIYLGARDLGGTIDAYGIYDEFRIWDRAIPPS